MVCGGIMNKLLKLGIAVISLFVIILTIIIIIPLIHPAISAQLTEAYATSALAVVTVLAVFYQSIIKYVKRPKFDVEFKSDNKEVRLKITNNGGSTAHLCKVALEIYNYEGDKEPIMSLFLPWDRQNENVKCKIKEGAIGFDGETREIPIPVNYNGIVLYSKEYEFAKLFFSRYHIFSIYGYPYDDCSDGNPPLDALTGSEDNKQNEDKSNKLEYSKDYYIKITVFCEEVSQVGFKTIHFYLTREENKKTCNYKFNGEDKFSSWDIP